MRVGIIGHTGRGNYGHYLDMAFVGVEGAEIVALADPDEAGRQAAVAKTGAPTGYADYVQMLEEEKPDIAVVASRGDRRSSGVGAQLCGARGACVPRKASGGFGRPSGPDDRSAR